MAAVMAVCSFLGGTAVGLSTGGLMGGLIGAVLGALVPATAISLRQLSRGNRALQAENPIVHGLPPDQALTVLSAAASRGRDGGGMISFRSQVLIELEQAALLGRTDPAEALQRVRTLAQAHPRSPAVHAELARRHLALHQPVEARASVSHALALALDGGMNPMAAKLVSEFGSLREDLKLSATHAARLAKVLQAHPSTPVE